MGTTERVHVVDDDASVRRSLARLLGAAGFEVATYPSADDFLRSVDDRASGCLLLDYDMPGLTGLDLQQRLLERGGHWQIVFLSGEAGIPESVQAMKDGAVDFLVKPARPADIRATVVRALDRHRITAAERAMKADVARRLEALSPREREVLGHVLVGRLNKQIADALGTAEKTVKIQRASVMQKMGVRSVAQLVRLTERAGIEI